MTAGSIHAYLAAPRVYVARWAVAVDNGRLIQEWGRLTQRELDRVQQFCEERRLRLRWGKVDMSWLDRDLVAEMEIADRLEQKRRDLAVDDTR